MPSQSLYVDDQRGWWDRIPDCCRGGFHSAEKVIGSLNPFVTEISIRENCFSCPYKNYSDLFFLFGDGQVA